MAEGKVSKRHVCKDLYQGNLKIDRHSFERKYHDGVLSKQSIIDDP